MSIGGPIALVGGLLLLLVGKVCLGLASKQIQGWLFDLCFLVLRWARQRLPTGIRVVWHDEELIPELEYILFEKYANEPIVGLYKGLRFAIGHVYVAKKLAKEGRIERARNFPGVHMSSIVVSAPMVATDDRVPEWMHREIRG